MLLRIPRAYWKAFGVVFTSVVAPLGIRHLDDTGHETSPAEPIPAETALVTSPVLSPATTRIVAQGTGSTPEAAFQNAIDTALQHAIVAEVSSADWSWHGQIYLASLRRNGDGILRGWRELSGVSERHLTGRVFRSEVAVEVDGEALRKRLKQTRSVNPSPAPHAVK